jgi:hypothetical protein
LISNGRFYVRSGDEHRFLLESRDLHLAVGYHRRTIFGELSQPIATDTVTVSNVGHISARTTREVWSRVII